MKSDSDHPGPGRIRLFGTWPGTELSVRDSRFDVVAHGVGHLDVSVAPGLYQVERRLGDTHETEIVAVRPGRDHVNAAVDLTLRSVAPVAADRQTDDEYRTVAESVSGTVAAHGDPARAHLVVVSDVPVATVLSQWQLLDEDLRPVDAWPHGWIGDRAAAWDRARPAGGHVLRRHGTDMPFWLSPGWQTIVFLRQAPHGFEVSLHLVEAGRPWRADSAANTAVEVARTALLRRRAVFRRDVVDALLSNRSDLNPMLGVLAAHALRAEWPSDDTTHDLIADRLTDLLPGHPDVEALSLWREGAVTPGRQRLAWPPMIHAAYRDLVVPADVAAPGVLVEHSLAYQIAGNLVSGGVWLKYEALGTGEEPSDAAATGRRATARAVARVRRFIADVAAIDGTADADVAAAWKPAAVALSTALPVSAVEEVMAAIRPAVRPVDGEPPARVRPLVATAAFVSARAGDDDVGAVLVREALSRRFGASRVHWSGRPPTAESDAVAWRELHKASVVVAVIGPGWLRPGPDGRRAIDRPDDAVRRELRVALDLGLPVIPVLLAGARLPTAAELPPDLASLAERQALRLSPRRIDADLEALGDVVGARLPTARTRAAAVWQRPPAELELNTMQQVRRKADATAEAQVRTGDESPPGLLGVLSLTPAERAVGGVYHAVQVGNLPTAGPEDAPTTGPVAPDLSISSPFENVPCRTLDPDLWFADAPADLELAKSLCRECPLRTACLAGALERHEPWGVWGGEIFERGVIVPRKRPRGRPHRPAAESIDVLVLRNAVARAFADLGYDVSELESADGRQVLHSARADWLGEHTVDISVTEAGSVRAQLVREREGAGGTATAEDRVRIADVTGDIEDIRRRLQITVTVEPAVVRRASLEVVRPAPSTRRGLTA